MGGTEGSQAGKLVGAERPAQEEQLQSRTLQSWTLRDGKEEQLQSWMPRNGKEERRGTCGQTELLLRRALVEASLWLSLSSWQSSSRRCEKLWS